MQLRQWAGSFLAILTALVLLVTGCGDDDGDSAVSAEQATETTEVTEAPASSTTTTTAPPTTEVPPVGEPDFLESGETVEIDSRIYYGPGDMQEKPEAGSPNGNEDVVLSSEPDDCVVESECPAIGLYTGHEVKFDCYLPGPARSNFDRSRFSGTEDPDARDTDKWAWVTITEEDHPYKGASGFVNAAWLRFDPEMIAGHYCE